MGSRKSRISHFWRTGDYGICTGNYGIFTGFLRVPQNLVLVKYGICTGQIWDFTDFLREDYGILRDSTRFETKIWLNPRPSASEFHPASVSGGGG